MALGLVSRHARPLALSLSTAALLIACASGSTDSDDGVSGDGGTSGSGGSTGSGGSAGADSTSGSTGTGGTTSSGSSSGTGGAAPSCGDGVKAGSEECDDKDFAGQSCADVLGDETASGPLSCTPSCTIDSSKCVKGPYCGNDKKDSSEQCDGNDVGTATCASATGDPGKTGALGCTAGCLLDTSKCVSGAKCGDGSKNTDTEQCDGSDLNGATCKSVLANTNATGTLKCTGACQFDQGGCTVPDYCGDGKKNGSSEECDGLDFGGATCETRLGPGHQGALLCAAATCTINTIQCETVPACGDGILNGTEQCDGSVYSPGATCASVVGFGSTGQLACAGNCTYDTASCSAPVTCGNDKLDAGEDCDGSLLNGKTCATVLGDSHAIGALACAASCVFDQSDCSIGPYCGDGKLQAGEECDDGNTVNTDRCSNTCKTICKGSETKWSVNAHCYIDADYTNYSDKSWDAAQAICAQTPGGHLVTITSQAEYDFVYNSVMPGTWDAYSTQPRWIGLNDKAVEGTFAWVTGEPVLATAWNSGEPNDSGGNEDCVEMKWSGGAWNDLDCTKTRPFICEVEPVVLIP